MSYRFTTRDIEPIPMIFQSRKVTRAEIGPALGEIFPALHAHAASSGIPIIGAPLVRYATMGADGFVIDAGIPVDPRDKPIEELGSGDIQAGIIPGGRIAVTRHKGPYEQLYNAHQALEVWLNEGGHEPAGPPWESYINDPGEVEPADYETEICAPIAKR